MHRDIQLVAAGILEVQELGCNAAGLERRESQVPTDAMLLYNAGCIYAMVGMREEALRSLSKAVDHGLKQIEWYQNDNNLDSLRADPEFLKIIGRLTHQVGA